MWRAVSSVSAGTADGKAPSKKKKKKVQES
jgi:hypothetical protein